MIIPKSTSQKGFTLIELLVVISIIALLSSIVLASLNDARAKARDAVRLSDMRQIQTALELYKNTNGIYPISATGDVGISAISGNSSWIRLKNELKPYIDQLPIDPKSINSSAPTASSETYNYWYYSFINTTYSNGCELGNFYFLAHRPETGQKNVILGPKYTSCNGTSPTLSSSFNGVWIIGVGK